MSYDGYDYPDEATLSRIATWEIAWEDKGTFPLYGPWFAFIKAHWWMPDWGWQEFDGEDDGRPARVYHISTGGWSGNESLLSAMRDNFVCYGLTFYVHKRGGHYEFRMPRRVAMPAESLHGPADGARSDALEKLDQSIGTLRPAEEAERLVSMRVKQMRLFRDLDNHLFYLRHSMQTTVGRTVLVQRGYLARVLRTMRKVLALADRGHSSTDAVGGDADPEPRASTPKDAGSTPVARATRLAPVDHRCPEIGADTLQGAFVSGAKWWEFESTHGTMWANDRDKAWAEAERRYGQAPGGDPEDPAARLL